MKINFLQFVGRLRFQMLLFLAGLMLAPLAGDGHSSDRKFTDYIYIGHLWHTVP